MTTPNEHAAVHRITPEELDSHAQILCCLAHYDLQYHRLQSAARSVISRIQAHTNHTRSIPYDALIELEKVCNEETPKWAPSVQAGELEDLYKILRDRICYSGTHKCYVWAIEAETLHESIESAVARIRAAMQPRKEGAP